MQRISPEWDLEKFNSVELSETQVKSISGGGLYWGTYYSNTGDGRMEVYHLYIRGNGSWYYYHVDTIDGVFA